MREVERFDMNSQCSAFHDSLQKPFVNSLPKSSASVSKLENCFEVRVESVKWELVKLQICPIKLVIVTSPSIITIVLFCKNYFPPHFI
jgi:hypothetical protein